MMTSLFAGVGPAICAVLLSMPLGAYTFVVGAGYPVCQASFQALLFAVDGIVVIYLTSFIRKGRQATQDAYRQLRGANEEITRSMARTREVIELSPDAFFQADLDTRFTDVNHAACRMLGYERDELVGKTLLYIVPAKDASRLKRSGLTFLRRDPSTERSGPDPERWNLRPGRGEFEHPA